MEGDRIGPKGGGPGGCARPTFSTSALNMTVLFSQQHKQCVWLTLLFSLVLYMVLFLMHHSYSPEWSMVGTQVKKVLPLHDGTTRLPSVLCALRPYGAGYVQSSPQSSKCHRVLQGSTAHRQHIHSSLRAVLKLGQGAFLGHLLVLCQHNTL